MLKRYCIIIAAILLTIGLCVLVNRRVANQDTRRQQPISVAQKDPVQPVSKQTSIDALKQDAASGDTDRSRAAFNELARIGSQESLQILISLTRTLGPGEVEDNVFSSAQYLTRPEVTEFLVDSFAKEENDSSQRLIAELFRRSVTPKELQRLVDKYENAQLQREVLAQLVGYLQEPKMVDAVVGLLLSSEIFLLKNYKNFKSKKAKNGLLRVFFVF